MLIGSCTSSASTAACAQRQPFGRGLRNRVWSIENIIGLLATAEKEPAARPHSRAAEFSD